MDLIKKASKLGYKYYMEFTIDELDKLHLSNSNKQIEYYFIQKWLREKYNIHIYIEPIWTITTQEKPDYNYTIISDLVKEELETDDLLGSYEEALERGLQQALNMIQLQTKFCQVLEVTIKTVAGTIERSIHERFRDVKVGDILLNGDQIIGRNMIEVEYSHTHELDGVVTLLTKEQLNSPY